MTEKENNELIKELKKLKKNFYKSLTDKNANIHMIIHNYFEKIYLNIFALQIVCCYISSNLEKITKKHDINKKDKDIIEFYIFILNEMLSYLHNASFEYDKYKFLYENSFEKNQNE